MIYRSYDPATGKLLWQLDMAKGRSSATPLAVDDRLFVGTEFRNRGGLDDGGGFLFAIKAGGAGDITPSRDADSGEYVAWKIARSGIQMASPVLLCGSSLSVRARAGILHCINAESGVTAYRSRVPGARAFWASPWTDQRVFCLDDRGTTHVLAGGPKLRVLGRNVIDEQSWSSPAIADDALFPAHHRSSLLHWRVRRSWGHNNWLGGSRQLRFFAYAITPRTTPLGPVRGSRANQHRHRLFRRGHQGRAANQKSGKLPEEKSPLFSKHDGFSCSEMVNAEMQGLGCKRRPRHKKRCV